MCTAMQQSQSDLMRAFAAPDGDKSIVPGIAYPSDKRADLLTHADFGCTEHEEKEGE